MPACLSCISASKGNLNIYKVSHTRTGGYTSYTQHRHSADDFFHQLTFTIYLFIYSSSVGLLGEKFSSVFLQASVLEQSLSGMIQATASYQLEKR